MSRRVLFQRPLSSLPHRSRWFCTSPRVTKDPRIPGVGREIIDDFAQLREHYATPKYPIVLAHGLFGFSELRLAPRLLPAVRYWHGIQDALRESGATVIATSVPPSSSIAERAAALAAGITAAQQASSTSCSSPPPPVNIIAHSMGGLDARYMISPAADLLLDPAARFPLPLPRLYGLLTRAGLGTEAFAQLTTAYARDVFNPATPDAPGVRYFSYGADAAPTLSRLSALWWSHAVVAAAEGANDGLVSVASSRWGEYRGTLVGVGHADLINWSNRVRWALRAMVARKRTFNAVAFYMDIADMLAREGL